MTITPALRTTLATKWRHVAARVQTFVDTHVLDTTEMSHMGFVGKVFVGSEPKAYALIANARPTRRGAPPH